MAEAVATSRQAGERMRRDAVLPADIQPDREAIPHELQPSDLDRLTSAIEGHAIRLADVETSRPEEKRVSLSGAYSDKGGPATIAVR